MILNFEEYTVELNPSEVKLAEQLALNLKLHAGKNSAVTGKQIIKYFDKHENVKLSGAKVRKLVQYIRQNNLAPNVCATSNGYFCAMNAKELEEYITGLKQRLNSIQFTLHCFQKYAEEDAV